MSAGERYARLMAAAASGNRKAARALLVGEWWPGDPDSVRDVDKVVRIAKAAALDDRLQDEAVVWLCEDCTLQLANEAPDPHYAMNNTCSACHDEGVECRHAQYEDRDFDTRPCGRCSTTLAGRRTRWVYWPNP